ncbi:GNAT family N-acetyltransferase [Desulfotomaculum nigrificans]|uniref:GNAT family N-acetyltransferase n=1 Tax=Desulfotomaculum nigrificans TaxID=1565 RepID=UPI0001FAE7BD|nr:GNAT family N-acetyltransferase [Desulfotomaculum nigrificans]
MIEDINVRISHEMELNNDFPAYYLQSFYGKIIFSDWETDAEESPELVEVGEVEFDYFDNDSAIKNGEDIFPILDDIDQEYYDLYKALSVYFGKNNIPNFLYLHRITVKEQYRSNGIASAVTERIEHYFKNKAKIAIVKPWPLGIDHDSEEFKKMQKKMVKHYQKLGYKKISDGFMVKYFW